MSGEIGSTDDIVGMIERQEAQHVLLAGPTASGKTRIVLEIAAQLQRRGRLPHIVNTDSLQVYAELRLVTARPTAFEMAAVPHHLFGHTSARAPYSVANWLSDVALTLGQLDVPAVVLFVGGSGLYFEALTGGLSPIPDINPEVRSRWRKERGRVSVENLHAILAERDPVAAAAIRPSDPQRTLRALEVLESTGRSLIDWQSEPNSSPLVQAGRSTRVVLVPDRAMLANRIGVRFRSMVSDGALEEVRAFQALNVLPDATAQKAIGVRELCGHLAGELTLENAIELSVAASRKYAKRQMTWFRQRMADWHRLPV